MKKVSILILGIVLVLAMFAMAVPAAAAGPMTTGVPATVTVNGGGGGSAPIVKAKWEQSPGVSTAPIKANESGDPAHATAGTQIAPPCVFNAYVPVQFWAIVTDPEGAADISTVMVDVFHPAGAPLNGSFKYQLLLTKMTLADGLAAYNAANAANLVKYNTGYSDTEIQFEFGKGTDVSVWMATGQLYYEQPCGDYTATFDAFDFENHWASLANPATSLTNTFTYVCVACVDIDFTSFSYGSVNVNMDKWINGDTAFNPTPGAAPGASPAGATVRNVGNTLSYVTVKTSDMGFGFNGTTATTYTGTTAPTPAQSNWNVYFDARLGNAGTIYYYDPDTTVQLTLKPLCLSSQDELDLSIHVIKSAPMGRSGTLTIGAVQAAFGTECTGIASHP